MSTPEPAFRSNPPPSRGRPLVNAFLLLATLVTTVAAGAVWDNGDPISHPEVMLNGLPFGLTLIAILLVHEAGHYLMCLRHGVNASLPGTATVPARRDVRRIHPHPLALSEPRRALRHRRRRAVGGLRRGVGRDGGRSQPVDRAALPARDLRRGRRLARPRLRTLQ